MDSRFLLYDASYAKSNNSGTVTDFGQVIQIISEKYINVNIEGASDANGNPLILEQVAVTNGYVPKLGDWVGIEWNNGQPYAVGSNNAKGGMVDNTQDVKIISSGDITNNVINSDHIQANTILAEHIKAGEIQGYHISANSIDASKLVVGTITAQQISANSITTDVLATQAVTADKIASKSITSAQISANAITSDLIAAGAITAIQISAGSITAEQMAVGTITAQSGILATAAVGTAVIADGSITNAKIGNAEITTAKIASGNITTALIGDAQITNAKILNLDAGKITTGYIDAQRIAANSITGQMISANSITGDRLVARTIDSDRIKAGAITATEIAGSTITGDKIQANTITGENIEAHSITTDHISTVGLDAQSVTVYNSQTGETLVGSGYLRVDGMDVGVVQSDNLVNNGLFLVNSTDWGLRRQNVAGESVLGMGATASGGNTVWKYDLATVPYPTLVSNNILAGKKPAYVLPSLDGKYLYVSNQGDGTISKIDLNAGDSVATLQVGAEPTVMKFTPDGKYIIGVNSDLSNTVEPDTINIIDANTFTMVEQVIVGSSPFDIAFGQNVAYITTAIDGDIYILDLTELKITGSIQGGLINYPSGIDISADYSTLYVANTLTDSVSKYNAATGQLLGQISVDDAPTFIKRYNGKLYVSASGKGTIVVIDEATFTVTTSVSAGVKPLGMVVNPYAGTAGQMFIASSGINEVLVMDLATNTIVGALQGGANTTEVALSPDFRYLYLANNGDSSFISFTYPSGGFIGDAYVASNGTTNYYGADGWMPNRSDRMYDGSGNIIGAASVEFHLGEPLNNEGGFAKLIVAGAVDQYAYIEQDIDHVTNFSDGISPSGTWFKYHNVSAQIFNQQPVAPNVVTKLEVDELVPKFVVVEDTQTTAFTPTSDGINEQYNGLVLSSKTNRLLNIGQNACDSSVAPSSPSGVPLMCFVDGSYSDSTQYVLIGTGNQWLSMDLGDTYMVNKIQMWRYYDDGRTYNGTKIEVSIDGTNWNTVYDQMIAGGYTETADGRVFDFPAIPTRFIRVWSNGNDKDAENRYVEIQAFADWKLESAPMTTVLYDGVPTQVPMTNNGTHITTDIPQAYVEHTVNIEFLSDWYYTYMSGTDYGVARMYIDGASQKAVDGKTNLYIFQNSNATAPAAYQGVKLKAGTHTIHIEQSTGKISFDRFRYEDFQYYTKSVTLFDSTNNTWQRIKLVPTSARSFVGQGKQSTSGAFDSARLNPATGQPDGSVPIKYRVRARLDLIGNGTQSAGEAFVTGVICEQGKLTTQWRMSESSERFPTERLEEWNENKAFSTGIQTKHIADGAVMGTKIKSHSLMDWHINPYAKIAEFKLDLNYPTHGHTNKAFLDSMAGFYGSGGNYGVSATVARGDHIHDDRYYTKAEIDARPTGGGGSGDISSSGNNTFYGSNTFNQPVVMLSDLTVSGNFYYKGSSSVAGDESITGSLTVGQAVNLSQQATNTGNAVRADRQINAGSGLSGGGNLVSDVTLSVSFGGTGTANTVSHSDHNHDTIYVRSDQGSQGVQGGFTVKSGALYIGSAALNSGGALVQRDNQGLDAIQIDSTGVARRANVRAYIDGVSGGAKFNGTVEVGSLIVDNTTLVANLNAAMVNSVKEADLAKSASILELGGYGVYSGLVATQTSPAPTMAVTLSTGTVYTRSGRRVVLPQQNVVLSPASTTGDRYDVIYLTGVSDVLGEGVIRVAQGTPSTATYPPQPDVPSDCIQLARVKVKQNASTVTDGSGGTADLIEDTRQMKAVYYANGAFYAPTIVTQYLYPSTGMYEFTVSAPMSCDGMNGQWAGSVVIPKGQTKATYSHGLNFQSGQYVVSLSPNNADRHAYWSNKTASSIDICIDDSIDVDITVDILIFGLA